MKLSDFEKLDRKPDMEVTLPDGTKQKAEVFHDPQTNTWYLVFPKHMKYRKGQLQPSDYGVFGDWETIQG